MTQIGGNQTALLQIQAIGSTKNAIGERDKSWADVILLKGWLDLASGDTRYSTYSAAIKESTHVFLCDYAAIPEDTNNGTLRMVIGNDVYRVQHIDDPMGMHEHLEIYLKYTGGQNG